MNQTTILIVIGVLGAIAFALTRMMPSLRALLTPKGETEPAWPLYAKKPLTQREQALFHRLAEALPECHILAQVQLSRFLGVKRGHNYAQWNNRINRLSADFVICAKDWSILAVVELDDSSHDRDDRRERDAKKDAALASAGIRVIRWNVKDIPSAERVRAEVAGGLRKTTYTRDEGRP